MLEALFLAFATVKKTVGDKPADKKKFGGLLGDMRAIVADPKIRCRDLYCSPINVQSFHRFFLDACLVALGTGILICTGI